MENSIKNKFKEEYENSVETPSASLWDKLEEKLDAAEDSIVIAKKPPINWWKYAAVVLCLITLGIIFKYNFQDKDVKAPMISKVKTPEKPLVKENTSIAEIENSVETPSASLWDKLEEKLDAAEDSIVIAKKPPINWWKYAAVVLCLITLGIIFKFSFQDKDVKAPMISKVKTPEKPLVKENTSIAEIENIEEQQIPNKVNLEKIPTEKESTAKIVEKEQKFTSNTQNLIQNKKPEIQLPDNFEEKRIVETPIVEKEEIKNIANNQNKVPAEKTTVKYVQADELLFGRELQKNKSNVAKNKKKGGFENSKFVKLITPSSIKILGITVYSEEEPN